jgi:DNA-binding MarR family transcriptional regulator
LPKQQQGLQVIQHLGQSYRVMQSAFSSKVGHALPRWRILLALHESSPCSQKHLAERCRLDPASLTRQLQAMQKLGWISRAVDAQDNRLTNASLTPAGHAVVNDALPRRARFFEESLKGLSATDIDTLNRVLSMLEANFQRASGDKGSDPSLSPSA